MSDPEGTVFERIYACLLRLFPPAFRRHYQQEALRLLSDRLSDEKGAFRRLRLSVDLLADMIGALPQAYRNSYAEAAPAALLTPHLQEAPSFQILQKEPMRRAAVVLGGFVSLTAAAAFICVMQGPIAYHPAQRKGHRSPIVLVMEHLNHPLSVDAAGNVPSGAPAPAANGAAAQPAGSGNQNPNPGNSGQAASRVAATALSPAPAQSAPIRVIARSAGPSNLQGPAPMEVTARVAANLSGTWTGSWRAARADTEIPRWFSLRQNGAKLSGTGGPNSTAQYAIANGLVAGDSVQFELHDGRRTFLYDLKVEDNGLRGTVSIRSENATRTVTVWFDRAR